MKIALINGTEKKGNTSFLASMLLDGLNYFTFSGSDSFDSLIACEVIVLASPVIFGGLSKEIVSVLTKTQKLFKGDFSTLPRLGKEKKGVIILTAGGFGECSYAEKTARLFLKMFNVKEPIVIKSLNTDKIKAENDENAKEQILLIREQLKNV